MIYSSKHKKILEWSQIYAKSSSRVKRICKLKNKNKMPCWTFYNTPKKMQIKLENNKIHKQVVRTYWKQKQAFIN
jgi:hypothetical protein